MDCLELFAYPWPATAYTWVRRVQLQGLGTIGSQDFKWRYGRDYIRLLKIDMLSTPNSWEIGLCCLLFGFFNCMNSKGLKWVDLCSSHVMPQLNQQFWLISFINLESITMPFIDSLFLCTFYDYFAIALYRDGSNIHTLFLHRSNFKSKGNCDCLNVGNLKINLRWRNCK